MANSVKSAGGFLHSTTKAQFIATSTNFSIVTCFRFDAAPATGIFKAGMFLANKISGTDRVAFDYYQDSPDSDNDIIAEYKLGSVASNTGHAVVFGTNTSLAGSWVHFAYTYNNITGAQNMYAILEGFNAGSPTFLATPSLGNMTGIIADNFELWNGDPGGVATDVGTGIYIGHVVFSAFEATQAQVLAQFAQRAPTSTFSSAPGTYSYLSMTDETHPETESGTAVGSYNQVTTGGAWTASSSQPIEWGGISGISIPTFSSYVTA